MSVEARIDASVAKRIREAQRKWGKQEDLAAATGIPFGTLQKIVQGKTDPQLSWLRALAEVMDVGLDWLVAGIGPESGDAETQVPADDAAELVRVPYYEIEASAGPGTLATDAEPKHAITFRSDWVQRRANNRHGLQAIRVNGDSMEPTLRSGDMIVIDTERTKESEGLFVLNYDGELLVKRLQRLSPTRLVIGSDNPLAGSSEIDLRDESQHPRIIGRVIWLGRDL